VVLAVTFWALTRDQDPDLAMLGLTGRLGEGVLGAAGIPQTLGLLGLATAGGANAPDPAAAHALAAHLLTDGVAVSALFFAVGSLAFSWLLLRGRMIPVPLAWLGVVASVLLVVLLPLDAAGFVGGPVVAAVMWVPMAAFEIPLGLWLLIKGVAPSRRTG
jgi:hypothetical protein